MKEYYNWSLDDLIEVKLENDGKYNLLAETLSRIGVQSYKKNVKTLYQTCHIIKGIDKYFICHFKELFALDGRQHTIEESDINRRNQIISLLQNWGLVEVVEPDKITSLNKNPMDSITIVGSNQTDGWVFVKKYDVPLKLEHLQTLIDNIDKKSRLKSKK